MGSLQLWVKYFKLLTLLIDLNPHDYISLGLHELRFQDVILFSVLVLSYVIALRKSYLTSMAHFRTNISSKYQHEIELLPQLLTYFTNIGKTTTDSYSDSILTKLN